MLKLNVHVKRTVPGDQDYSSRSVCVGLEVECPDTLIHDPNDLQRKISGLLDDVDEAVLQRLLQEKPQDKNQDFRNRIEQVVGQNGSNGNGSRTFEPASKRQKSFASSLARKHRLSRDDLDALVCKLSGCTGLGDEQLSKQACSDIIEALQEQS